ncbi:MAG TPA: cation:proton antiporter [Candidatus Blautia faecigallinarum]|uniref:Cation:proton antiporter n=1 Tax=Candidatus Blautia faecigallinarum TaxID=2838488 RepID=A0A9D2DUK1_9FIRM|nr:cation:proton antiporter [Candidatus Blautia faecigallinarum]
METYVLFKDLAIILIFAKICGLIAGKLKAPQVVGEIIAGLLIGPSVLGLVEQTDFISGMAEIGVVLLMFFAGLQTSLKDLMRTGWKAFLIACSGVLVPLVGGYFLYCLYYGFAPSGTSEFYSAVFTGVILTATSVSITVASLQELGYLKSETGTTIMSAAIIDDVIGIIVLTFVVGMKDPDSNPGSVVLSTVLFFILALILGFVVYKLFTYLDKLYPHTRRIPILGMVLAFAMAYLAERYFGIADITGAYVAGIVLCSIQDSEYIARKVDISSYMVFGPLFFASIGLKTSIDEMTPSLLLFCILFVLVGLVTKIVGCGLMSKVLGFNAGDSLKIGVGMMTRGEVALIVAQKGLSVGMIEAKYFSAVILLILISSVITPIALKLLYGKKPAEKTA